MLISFFLSGLRLLWDGVSFLEITVPPKFRNRLCGLCGNFNGDKRDDFYGRKGKNHLDGQHFGNSWRVGGYRACSILPQDMPKSYEPHCSQSWESRISSDKFCNALQSSLFDKCHDAVNPEYYLNACKLDMCECPGNQCHCEVLTAYARACERSGNLIHDWREATNCKNLTSYGYKRRNNLRNQMKAQLNNSVLEKAEDPKKTLLPLKDKIGNIGKFLPACSPKTEKFCQADQPGDGGVQSNSLEKRNLKRISRKERKRLRRQKRKKERQRKRRLRRQRKKRKLKKMRKRQRQQRHKRKRNGVSQIELERLGRAGITLIQSNDTGEVKSRLNWSKFKEARKVPPFESLLNSFDEDLTDKTVDHTNEGDNYDSQDYEQFENILRNTSAIVRKFNNSDRLGETSFKGKRVPLPLLDNDSLVTGSVQRPRRRRSQIWTPRAASNFMKRLKNWKHRRRPYLT